ncbi:MAG: hypothetical protein J5725_02950 [Bacteroidales bacterium]|nr:hypothetical protein [Bacteroidales bacterium]
MTLYKVTKKQSGSTLAPLIISAQSRNTNSIGSLTYTFTGSGTFQYYVYMGKNSAIASTDTVIKLNGTAITPTFYSTGNDGFFYGEITASADDVISVENVTAISNYGLHLFVLQNADISNFSFVGMVSNNGATFVINTGDSFYLNVFQCGYYSGNNNFHYEIGRCGNESVSIPNQSQYYYGRGYVITI